MKGKNKWLIAALLAVAAIAPQLGIPIVGPLVEAVLPVLLVDGAPAAAAAM